MTTTTAPGLTDPAPPPRPPHAEPSHVEPSHVEPSHVEPSHAGPDPTPAQPVRINPSSWNVGFGYDQAQLRPAPRWLLTLSGQGPTAEDGALLHEGDVTAQLSLAMRHVEDLLTQAGMDLRDVLRLTIYTTEMDQTLAAYGAVLERLQRLGATPPATLVGVQRLALPGMAVEIEVSAGR